jgi:hypothetical protein
MPSARLHIDPAARAVTAKAAAGAEAQLIQTVATPPADQVVPVMQGAVPNGFNQTAAALTARASVLHRLISAELARKSVAAARVAEAGLNALDATNEINAVALSTVGERA